MSVTKKGKITKAIDFDYVIDLVGGKISEICAEIVSVFGTYVDVTYITNVKTKEMLFDKATTIVNIANYAYTSKNRYEKFEYYRNALKEIFNKIEREIITPTEINNVGNFSVQTIHKAHQIMENNETNGKKLIMSFD